MHTSEKNWASSGAGGKQSRVAMHYWIGALLFLTSQGGIVLAAIGDGWMDALGAALLAPSCLVLVLYLGVALLRGPGVPGR